MAQSLHQLAVIDDAAAEGGLGHPRPPAEARNLFQELFGIHWRSLAVGRGRKLGAGARCVNFKSAHHYGGT
jgi:hypothetical protein